MNSPPRMHGMVQEFSSELCGLSDHVQVDTYSVVISGGPV